MGQTTWIVSLITIGLFAVAILSFAVNFGIDNNAPVNIQDDPQLSGLSNSLNNNLSNLRSDSQNTITGLLNSSIAESGQTTQTAGQFSITYSNSIGVVTNILRTGYYEIFGTENGFSIFLTTFLSIIGFITAMLLWKTWAGRNPD